MMIRGVRGQNESACLVPKDLLFGTRPANELVASAQPYQFIEPMVVKNLPPFQPNNPASVALYQGLVERAQAFARPEVSGRRVGVVAIGESGRAYLGGNVEIKGSAPGDVIHAEAFALTLARQHGEKSIRAMVQSLTPCGPCRQVIRETGYAEMPIYLINPQTKQVESEILSTLLPNVYSYASPDMNMFKAPALSLPSGAGGSRLELARKALNGAGDSYLPRPDRKTWAGIAVRLKNGEQYTAPVINISGPNPTITPLQNILIQLIAKQAKPEDMVDVVLVEPKDPDYSFYRSTQALLEILAPQAKLRRTAVE